MQKRQKYLTKRVFRGIIEKMKHQLTAVCHSDGFHIEIKSRIRRVSNRVPAQT